MVDFLKLTKSVLRKKILLYFFSNPDSNLYVREIAGILMVDAGNLSKELGRLEKSGIFSAYKRGNQKYFALNKDFPLYGELKSIIFKTIGIEGRLKEIVGGVKRIVKAFIYGSFAEGKENAESDIDLLVIGNPDEDELMRKIDAFEKEIGREINYNIYSAKEFHKRLGKKDSFITNILRRRLIVLKGNLHEV